MQISAEKAERVWKASILKARKLRISVCIAILDSGGHLKAFHRVDGAWLGVNRCGYKEREDIRPVRNGNANPSPTTAKQGQMRMELSSPMATS